MCAWDQKNTASNFITSIRQWTLISWKQPSYEVCGPIFQRGTSFASSEACKDVVKQSLLPAEYTLVEVCRDWFKLPVMHLIVDLQPRLHIVFMHGWLLLKAFPVLHSKTKMKFDNDFKNNFQSYFNAYVTLVWVYHLTLNNIYDP